MLIRASSLSCLHRWGQTDFPACRVPSCRLCAGQICQGDAGQGHGGGHGQPRLAAGARAPRNPSRAMIASRYWAINSSSPLWITCSSHARQDTAGAVADPPQERAPGRYWAEIARASAWLGIQDVKQAEQQGSTPRHTARRREPVAQSVEQIPAEEELLAHRLDDDSVSNTSAGGQAAKCVAASVRCPELDRVPSWPARSACRRETARTRAATRHDPTTAAPTKLSSGARRSWKPGQRDAPLRRGEQRGATGEDGHAHRGVHDQLAADIPTCRAATLPSRK